MLSCEGGRCQTARTGCRLSQLVAWPPCTLAHDGETGSTLQPGRYRATVRTVAGSYAWIAIVSKAGFSSCTEKKECPQQRPGTNSGSNQERWQETCGASDAKPNHDELVRSYMYEFVVHVVWYRRSVHPTPPNQAEPHTNPTGNKQKERK